MRSKLFVPGSRPEFFAKALAGDADVLAFDLEDAVDERRKVEARAAVAAFLVSNSARASAKIMTVRVNAVATSYFAADVAALAPTCATLLNVPKVETPEHVAAAVAALERAESGAGRAAPLGIFPTIETPKALRHAAEIATTHPRVVGLQLGFADLLEPLGIDRRNAAAIQHLQLTLRLAAGEAGIWVYDGAFADTRDDAWFSAEAEGARRLGYIGKSCIHPRQVALANAAFQPTAEEIAHALRVVEAAREAQQKGIGAYLVDGRMVDGPFARRAAEIVATARRLGLGPG
jgi:citrate lyase subunit beta / citryl-CoA lyase